MHLVKAIWNVVDERPGSGNARDQRGVFDEEDEQHDVVVHDTGRLVDGDTGEAAAAATGGFVAKGDGGLRRGRPYELTHEEEGEAQDQRSR